MISNRFNEYFVNVGYNLANKIKMQPNSYEKYLGDTFQESMFLSPVTKEEIYSIISTFDDTSGGWDDIAPRSIKFIKEIIQKPLMHICNLSFCTGIVSEWIKIARVVPIYKHGDPSQFNNYRPVSVLDVFSKVYERLFYNRLMKYLNKHQIRVLYELKFGFLKKKTFNRTCTYICLIEKIISAIERNEFTVAAFLDLAKSIYDMNKYSFGMFCYKCHFGLLSDVFDNVFIKVSNFHRHHTRSQCNFHVRTSRVIYVDKSVKCRGTLLWNQLRDNVNNSPNFNIFKKQLVSFLRGSWMSVECCNCAYMHTRMHLFVFLSSFCKLTIF